MTRTRKNKGSPGSGPSGTEENEDLLSDDDALNKNSLYPNLNESNNSPFDDSNSLTDSSLNATKYASEDFSPFNTPSPKTTKSLERRPLHDAQGQSSPVSRRKVVEYHSSDSDVKYGHDKSNSQSSYAESLKKLNKKYQSHSSPLSRSTYKERTDQNDSTSPVQDYCNKLLRKYGLSIPHVCSICILLILIIVGVIIVWPMNVPEEKSDIPSPESRQEIVNRFELNFNEIMSRFSRQSRRFWKTLKAATMAVLRNSDPNQPVILLLASKEDNHQMAECIAKHLSESITKAYMTSHSHKIIRRDTYYTHMSGEDLKLSIDNDLNEAFSAGSKSVVIPKVHEFPGKAAMIFHAYCDNENAPYKDAAMIFTTFINNDYLSESRVEESLSVKWGEDLDIDMLTPLMSRVANNIALVENEDEWKMKEYC